MTSQGSATLQGLTVRVTSPDGRARNLDAFSDTARWTSAAVGGFGSLTLKLPGQLLPRETYLATVEVTVDQQVIYQGTVEDVEYDITEDQTTLQAFGPRRALDTTPAQGVWAQTDLKWREMRIGLQLSDGGSPAVTMTNRNVFTATAGVVSDDDLTIRGVRFAPIGGYSLVQGDAKFMHLLVPDGIRIHRFSCYFESTAQALSVEGILGSAVQGGLWTPTNQVTSTGQTLSTSPAAGANQIILGVGCYQTPTPGNDPGTYLQFTRTRLLGLKDEDITGAGFYGGTLIRDLIGYIPTLTAGRIDPGTEFMFDVFGAEYPTIARALFDEVTSLYTKELAVWEDGQVDWAEPQLDEPHWVCQTTDLLSGSRITGTVDDLITRTILLYQDATVENETNTAEATGGGDRNPYARVGREKTEILQAGFPMTPTSAAALARRLNVERAETPTVTGTAVLPANAIITNVLAGPRPAWMIRAGQNLLVTDLPKTEAFQTGRDGETLFHIVSADVDLGQNTVTLALDGQTTRADVLLARLAAATRVVTG